jgi:hypothetical protein
MKAAANNLQIVEVNVLMKIPHTEIQLLVLIAPSASNFVRWSNRKQFYSETQLGAAVFTKL